MHKLPTQPQRPPQPVYAVKSTVQQLQQHQQAAVHRPRILGRGFVSPPIPPSAFPAPSSMPSPPIITIPPSAAAIGLPSDTTITTSTVNTPSINNEGFCNNTVNGGNVNPGFGPPAVVPYKHIIGSAGSCQGEKAQATSTTCTTTTTVNGTAAHSETLTLTSIIKPHGPMKHGYQKTASPNPTPPPAPLVLNQQKIKVDSGTIISSIAEIDLPKIQLGEVLQRAASNVAFSVAPSLSPGVRIEKDSSLQKSESQVNEMVVIKLDERHIFNTDDNFDNIIITLDDNQLMQQDKDISNDLKTNGKVKIEEDEISDELIIRNLVDELIDNVIIQSRQSSRISESELERKPKSVKVAKGDKILQDFQPIIWEGGIGRLPGTDLAFHVSDRGRLELYCPFLPIKEKMDRAVLKVNIKRKDNTKKPKIKPAPVAVVTAPPPPVPTTASVSFPIPQKFESVKPILKTALQKGKTTLVRKSQSITPKINAKPVLAKKVKPSQSNFPALTISPPIVKIEPRISIEDEQKPVLPISPKSPASVPSFTMSEPIIASLSPPPSASANKKPKIEIPPTLIATTFCAHCSLLGEVTSFVEGKYCSTICQRTMKMMEAEQLKQQRRLSLTMAGQSDQESGRVKRKYVKKCNKPEKEKVDTPKPPPKVVLPEPQVPKNAQFSWTNYLKETNSRAAPARCFRQPALPQSNPFKVGMMMEAIDPQHQSLFCVVEIAEIQGYRLRLRFTGYSDIYDFWVNADSFDIFPPGWCEENGQTLQPPPDYPTGKTFNWHQYIVDREVKIASREFFSISHEDTAVISEVQVGMKLEAVDLRNLNYICVATVANVIGERFLIHFDSWDNLFDYWTDLTSPFIHPIGWCEANSRDLVPPQWGDEPEANFLWEQYLKETKSSALPAKLFRPLDPIKFKKGMKLECVDKRNPSLVRVATISEVDAHFIGIHFDNWLSRYDYKVYELSPDIHPIGWCAHTGHVLQPPPTPPPANDSVRPAWNDKPCPVFGCYGVGFVGHIEGPKIMIMTHNSDKHCPYSEVNYLTDWTLADRLAPVNADGKGEKPSATNGGKPRMPNRRSSTTKKALTSARRASKASSHSDTSVTQTETPKISNERAIRATRRSGIAETDLPRRTSKRGRKPSIVQGETKKPEPKKARKASEIEDQKSSPVPIKKKRKAKSTEQQERASSEEEVHIPIPAQEQLTIEIPTTSSVKSEPEPVETSSIKLTQETTLVQVCGSAQEKMQISPATTAAAEEPQAQPVASSAKSSSEEQQPPPPPPVQCIQIAPSVVPSGFSVPFAIFDSFGSSPMKVDSQRISMDSLPIPIQSLLLLMEQQGKDGPPPINFGKHIQRLYALVSDLNATIVSEWGIEEVSKFLIKLGCSEQICQRFREQKIDGESFLLLTIRDITGLGFPYGPALKISYALRLINLTP